MKTFMNKSDDILYIYMYVYYVVYKVFNLSGTSKFIVGR